MSKLGHYIPKTQGQYMQKWWHDWLAIRFYTRVLQVINITGGRSSSSFFLDAQCTLLPSNRSISNE